jgi:GT2 family glycosyltransferase
MDSIKTGIDQRPLISIVVLNWNGYSDTIQCLSSLLKCDYNNFEIILVDNGSTDDSVNTIKRSFNIDDHSPATGSYKLYRNEMITAGDPSFIKLQIIENPENLGFAKGNNKGIAQALKDQTDFIMLLNNDTIVNDGFLNELVDFFGTHDEYAVASPQIRYFDKPEIIWNCGGKLNKLGSRKYFYNEKPYLKLPPKDFLNISFITGCCIIVKAEIFERFGSLTEKFFFGEEDYEFSIRLKKNGIKVACALKSVIYHKVSSSISRVSEAAIGKVYIHYLNRFIDLKDYMPNWKWQLWQRLYMVYIFILLNTRHKIPARILRKFSISLLNNSRILNGVDRLTFEKYIVCDFT